MINMSIKSGMQSSVSLEKSNILGAYFLDSINRLEISCPFCHLLGLAYGYDEKSTEPRITFFA